ncbi:MAG: NAD regulator [Pseudomonadota bacterium]
MTAAEPIARVAIGLNAVVAVVDDGRPKVLCRCDEDGVFSLPYGPFDPARHRTFEIGLREWVTRQTQIDLGYIEQLYTFGDEGREAPAAAFQEGAGGERIVSVGYLALAPEPADVSAARGQWRDWYDFFPWEDWRAGEPTALSERVLPRLAEWAARASDEAERAARARRIDLAFGADGWEEERALDRYELMYEADLVAEAVRDRGSDGPARAEGAGPAGAPMASDHRRILATAVGRLRGKLKYRPVVFRVTPPEFTLLDLQRRVEALIGFSLHKQNFRRNVETGGFVERTGASERPPSGRPAAVFRASDRVRKELAAAGLTIPRLRRRARFFGDDDGGMTDAAGSDSATVA